jgi:hypothetical protein
MSLSIESRAEPIPGYRLIERVGGGGFGEVWKAEAPGGLLKAIKIIHGDLHTADPEGGRHAEQELKSLKRVQAIRHPYLLSLDRYDIVQGRLLIVMELADCNLWDRFRECRGQGLIGIPRGELMRYMEEASEVLDLMNNQYTLQHLDIKPQNLFLVHSHVKVADFGLVKDLEGVRAAITGGVTPVYAAPETFDGVATRFCDQYSLAIVYQELLTGVRPFNGTNIQQLLLQHIQGVPNVAPLPPADRGAVSRALSKRPEDRFPTCLQFVRALQQSGADAVAPPARVETPVGAYSTIGATARGTVQHPPAEPPPDTPRTELRSRRDEGQSSSAVIAPAAAPAREEPPEQTGPGALKPAIIVGIGQGGIDVLRHFRRQVAERYGTFERLPHLRLLCIDTDAEALQKASGAEPGSLAAGEVVPMRLNRAGHYLKPRRNGRSLIEGWFDPQTLYRIPRNAQTLGLRCLGRLAYCDHYASFAARLRTELEACRAPEALERADRHTKLGLRSSRPRIYVVAGLGGGTGGGMFLDAAYTAKHRLRQLGYSEPDVVGVFLLPPADRATKPQAVANTFAALKELNHFCLPETAYITHHDDKDGFIHDPAAPCARFHVVPLEPPPSEAAPRRAAELLFRELLGPLGRVADAARAAVGGISSGQVSACVHNQAAFAWPKQIILSHAARWLGETVVGRWLKKDPVAIAEPVRGWLKDRWDAEELGPEPVAARLRAAAEKEAGRPPEELFADEAKPFVPRGWFARDPDAEALAHSFSRVLALVGIPDENLMQRQVGSLEKAVTRAGEELVRDLGPKLKRLPRNLLEHPDYRLPGAEGAIEQLQARLAQLLEQHEPLAAEASGNAIDAFYVIAEFLTDDRVGRRRPTAAEVAQALRDFPTWRVRFLVQRQLCQVYFALGTHLSDLAREVRFCRQRLEELHSRFRLALPVARLDPEMTLFPPGWASPEAAVKSLQDAIRPDELRALDKALQKQIEQMYQALFSVCMSSLNMVGTLHGVVEEQARNFLSARLGELDVGEMFQARFGDEAAAVRAFRQIHEAATPPLKTGRTVTQEVCVVALPDGPRREFLEQAARQALPGRAVEFTASPEEVFVYREWPRFPLAALSQLGPQAEDAYNQLEQAGQVSPHSRSDVGQWSDV